MSVSSAMYAAITGLDTMGTAMSVISNNIANVNTVGFKAGRASFMDLLSQRYNTAAGSSQIGKGVRIGSITQVFSQGTFKRSAQDTDVAISGEGFFQVRDPLANENYYTRAGNFLFDKDGNLTSPTGHILQGWELNDDGERVGSPTDVSLDDFSVPPTETTKSTFIFNVDAEADSRTDGVNLSSVWDGSNTEEPIEGEDYTYHTSLRVYDSLGEPHDLSVYLDPLDTLQNKWEYIVCADPSEDMRTHNGNSPQAPAGTPSQFPGMPDGPGIPFQDTKFGGMVQRGTISFEPVDPVTGSGGQIREITADKIFYFEEDNVTNLDDTAMAASTSTVTLSGTGGTFTGVGPDVDIDEPYNTTPPVTTIFTVTKGGTIGDPANLPEVTYQDSKGETHTLIVSAEDTTYTTNEGLQIQFSAGDLALNDEFEVDAIANWTEDTPNQDGYFTITPAFVIDPGPNPAAHIPDTPTYMNVDMDFGAKNPSGVGDWQLNNPSSTQYAAPSTTLFQTQDGYASGYLQRVTIDPDGTLTGTYSNGVNMDRYQIGLAIFRNQWGLEKKGDNLYSENRDSGLPTINTPGTGGAGTLSPNSLEQSNVDLAEEFVDMIVQQRGFQANSKVITTTDTMLAELINLKR